MSDGSFVPSFCLIEDNISPVVVDPTGLSVLRALCALLPEGLATFWGLECRLGQQQPGADILFEMKRGSPGHIRLSGDVPSSLDPLCADFPVWALLRDFAGRWADVSQPGMQDIRNIWLEFDSAAATGADDAYALAGAPSLFWGTELTADTDVSSLQVLFQEMAKFHGEIVVPAYLYDVVQTLPKGAVLFQAGMMVSRQQPVVRLCVNKVNGADTLKWLGDIGWPGDMAELAVLFDVLRPVVDSVAVDIDVTASGIQPKLGLECYLSWANMDAAQWEPLLDMLVTKALSRSDKAEGILAFPGHGQTLKDNVIGDAVYTHYGMNIHHIKLVVMGAQIKEAKAYLGFHRPGVRYGEITGKSTTPGDNAWLVE